jgi:leucyl aminopeptidase
MHSFQFISSHKDCACPHEILLVEKLTDLESFKNYVGFIPQGLETILSKPGQFLAAFGNTQAYLILSLGDSPSASALQKTIQSFFAKNLHLIPMQTCIHSGFLQQPLDANKIEALIKGMLIGQYKISLSKNEDSEKFSRKIILKDLPKNINWDQTLAKAQQLAAAKTAAMHWVDLPSNIKTPQFMKEVAMSITQNQGLSMHCVEGASLEKEGLHALAAVGRGSERPPLMVVLRYQCGIPSAPHLGLVGKGVTFDTGGISIKPSANMHFMKSDMGGAAAVLGAMQSIAAMALPLEVTCVLPFTENCLDSKAIKPGDVISSYSGKTIEIIDTDAEGRLILADALSYLVKNYPCDYLLDLATLTGSAVRTFGSECAALFSNHLEFQSLIQKAGDRVGEKSWPLPLWETYAKNLRSDVADIANYSGKPICGAIDAALFLQSFTGDHPAWAHLDIAGVAYTSGDFSSGKSASGYGVELIVQLANLICEL